MIKKRKEMKYPEQRPGFLKTIVQPSELGIWTLFFVLKILLTNLDNVVCLAAHERFIRLVIAFSIGSIYECVAVCISGEHPSRDMHIKGRKHHM